MLPFKSLAAEGGQEWLGDGMTEALITELSRRRELEVIGHASSAHYRDTHKSLRQVAAELQVDHLLEGAVTRAGEELHWHPRFQEILRRIGVPPQLEYIRRALDWKEQPARAAEGPL